MNQCFYLKKNLKEKALRMAETSLQGGWQYGSAFVMSYLAIDKGDVHHYRGDKVAVEGKTKFASLFISPNKDFGGEVKPRWMCFTHENLVRDSRRRKFRDSVARCEDVGPFLAAELFDHDFFASHELNGWFLLLVGFPETIRCCRKEILLSQLHFKDGFSPSDLPKRKRTAGLRLKEDFSKKRISRL